VGARAAVASLEDRIAWVDDALSDAQFARQIAEEMQALERERAQLVELSGARSVRTNTGIRDAVTAPDRS
jgi:hypothetical protein